MHLLAITLWLAAISLCFWRAVGNPKTVKGDKKVWIVSGLFACALALTTLLGSSQEVFFGLKNFWLGSFSLICMIAVGWLVAPYITKKTAAYYVGFSVLLSFVSIVTSMPRLLAGERLTGLVQQSNMLAILLGVGVIVAALFLDWSRYKYWLLAAEVVLVTGIVLTQTRAVILATPVIVLVGLIMQGKLEIQKKVQVLLIGLALATSLLIMSPRLANWQRLEWGISYRADLIAHSSNYLKVMPAWGLGPGGLSDVITDYYPLPVSLQHTLYVDHKIPESSHTIILDRFLEYGWLGGLAYMAFVVVFLFRAYRARHDSFLVGVSMVGIFMLLQLSVTVAWLPTEFIAWVAMLCVILRVSKPDYPN